MESNDKIASFKWLWGPAFNIDFVTVRRPLRCYVIRNIHTHIKVMQLSTGATLSWSTKDAKICAINGLLDSHYASWKWLNNYGITVIGMLPIQYREENVAFSTSEFWIICCHNRVNWELKTLAIHSTHRNKSFPKLLISLRFQDVEILGERNKKLVKFSLVANLFTKQTSNEC